MARLTPSLSIAALVGALVLTAWAAPARACSCAVPDARSARDAATWVFEGVLTGVGGVGDPNAERGQGTFRVSRVWKGTLTQDVTVEIPALQSMCPPHFEVGERYIVYVGGTEAAPSVAACARYAFGPGLAAERRALGRPITTFGNPGHPSRRGRRAPAR